MKMVQVIGKRVRPVPIIIPEELLTAMDVLVETRKQCGVDDNNGYFFAIPMSQSHLHFWPTMQRVSQQARLKRPELVTSTRIRKHLATMAQLIDLTPTQLDWLSNHLGHGLNIHKSSYRLHTSAIELTKVGRVLMSVDSGDCRNYHGKSLNAIQSQPLGESSSMKPATSSPDDGEVTGSRRSAKRRQPAIASDDEVNTGNRRSKKKKLSKISDEEDDTDIMNDEEDKENAESDADACPTVSSSSLKSRRRQHGVRRPWSSQELAALGKAFSSLKRPPTFAEVRELQRVCPSLRARSEAQIKTRAWAIIKNY